jgi:hypothetical protein
MRRIEPPRRQGRQVEKREIERERESRKIQALLSLLKLFPPPGELGILAVQFFDGFDRFEPQPRNSSRASKV